MKKLVDGILTEVQMAAPSPSLAEGRPGSIFVRGEFARADEATANGRIYPRTLWETQIQRLSSAMADRKVLGELDHPDDGRTLLQRVSHYMTGLHVAEDGRVIGEAIILDTARGRDLKAMLTAGCKIGVSSRGFGTTIPHPTLEGKEVVQSDYQLETFDFVAQPADASAYPQMFTEGYLRQHPNTLYEAYSMTTTDTAMNVRLSSLETEIVRLIETVKPVVAGVAPATPAPVDGAAILAALKEHKDHITDLKNEIDTLKEGGDLQESAELTEARAELAKVRAELAEARTGFEERGSLLREASYQLFVSQSVHQLSPSDTLEVRRVVGDVKRFNSLGEIRTVIENAKAGIKARAAAALAEQENRRRREREISEARAAERAAAAAERAKLEEQLRLQQEVADRSLEAVQTMALDLYIERALATNPRSAAIREIIAASNVVTEAAVDAIIRANSAPQARSGGVDAARERVRTMVARRTGAVHEGSAREERGAPRRGIDESMDIPDFDLLAGVGAPASR